MMRLWAGLTEGVGGQDGEKALLELAAHSEIIHRTSVSLDGAWLVTSGEDKLTKVWNLHTVDANIKIEKTKRATVTRVAPPSSRTPLLLLCMGGARR